MAEIIMFKEASAKLRVKKSMQSENENLRELRELLYDFRELIVRYSGSAMELIDRIPEEES